MLFFLVKRSRTAVILRAGAMIALIAFADWRIEGNIPLGFLYLFPMLQVGGILRRWEIGLASALCTFLTESFDTFEWSAGVGIPRDILIFAAFFGMGLFVYEVVRSRQAAQLHTQEIERVSEARRDAEEQLKALIESSPAAIFSTDSDGVVLLANDAAHRMFALEPGALRGRPIRKYLPSLVNIPAARAGGQLFRTAMQCRGRREDGEAFLADIWFSTYRTGTGRRMAAMVVDTSEELRSREEFSLQQLLASSRILVGAVSHEVRNVCAAIAMVHANLVRGGTLAQSKDFEALGNLIASLETIAAMELLQTADRAAEVDLTALLEELRIVVEPSLREHGIEVRWEVEPGLPAVWADRQNLMQVFLNLTKNSERAMLNRARRELTIEAKAGGNRIAVEFRDSGGGVSHPARLFRPFHQQAESTGLGLYLSRAFVRSFRGDLRYEPEPQGANFTVELALAASGENETYGPADPDSVSGRSQLVPGKPGQAARSGG